MTWIIQTMNPEVETAWRTVGCAVFHDKRNAEDEMRFFIGRNPSNKYRVIDTDKRGTSIETKPRGKDGPFWYETQERAMAPGSGDGWPTVIRPQHSGNARLVRCSGDPKKAFAACQIALDRLVRLHGFCAGDETQDVLREALETQRGGGT